MLGLLSILSHQYGEIKPVYINPLVLKLVLSFSFSLYLSLSFYGQVMSPHHSDQMSQRSQVSRVALCMSKVKVVSSE